MPDIISDADRRLVDTAVTRIVLPWPSRAMSPNARVHWRRKHAAAKNDRAAGFFLSARLTAPHTRPLPVRVTFHPPDRRRRDRDNMIAAFKAMADGVADAIHVDDAEWEPVYAVGDPVKGGKVVVRL